MPETGEPPATPAKPKGQRRWIWWFAVAAMLNTLLFFLYPSLICGHFTMVSFLPCLLPLPWGVYMLLSYRNWNERVIGWISCAAGLAWLWIGLKAY